MTNINTYVSTLRTQKTALTELKNKTTEMLINDDDASAEKLKQKIDDSINSLKDSISTLSSASNKMSVNSGSYVDNKW